MKLSLSLVFFSAIAAVLALPVVKRNATTTATDIQVLAFADVLEKLESTFYTEALKKFNATNFMEAGFATAQVPIQQITTIAKDENIHAVTLESAIHALGGQVVSNCTFNFTSALTNVETMVATARAVENVGVSAYLGALTAMTDPALVTAAGSILTVEARHQTILNLLSNATSIPQPFDVALTPADVLAIAGNFVSGCKLGFTANAPLTVTNTAPLQAGTALTFTSPALNGTIAQNNLSCKIVAGGANTTILPLQSCTVPKNVTGPMYVWVVKGTAPTMNATAMSPMNTTTMAAPMPVVAGPALVFVNEADLLGGLARPGVMTTMGKTMNPMGTMSSVKGTTPPAMVPPMASPPPTGSTTMTISPAQASALLSSFAASPTHF